MTILAIDPGPLLCGWVVLDGQHVMSSGVDCTATVLMFVRSSRCDWLAVEKFEARGMAMGQESIDTMVMAGRLQQAWRDPEAVRMVYRRTVKLHVCGSAKAKDANIRQALIDMWPAGGGGKVPQIGTKRDPGPLYGISSHAWAALAVAVTVRDGVE